MKLTKTFVLMLALVSCKPNTNELESLRSEILEEFQKHEGTFGVAYKNLETGEELYINENEVFHAASTMKTPVMIEVFKQAAEGKLHLNDSIEIKNTFSSIVDSSSYRLHVEDDSENELYDLIGTKRLLSDLVYDMIIVSSNLATNIVIELVDAKKVTNTMRTLGAKDIQVLRGVEDQKAFDNGLSNTTTPLDLMIIFEKMAKGEAVNKESDERMIEILLDQKYNEIIPGNLPTEVKVAHKTGWIRGVHHDSALVILPDGKKYVLVLLSKELMDEDNAVASMAKVSRLIYDHVVSEK
ncbi:MAG: serine hydrolase [Cyclobacteriaceae bacterium]